MKDIYFRLSFNTLKKLHDLQHDLPFLTERIEIEKVEKFVPNLHDKTENVIHMRNLNHRLVLKKVHRVIKYNQNTWLKPYIDINTDFKKAAKNDFEKDFYRLMNNSVFRKTMENVRKHRDIKLATTEKRRNYLVSEPNYQATKFFIGSLLVIEIKKSQIIMSYLSR